MGDNIGLGIVGLGGAATQMLPSIVSHHGFSIVGAADPRPEARARFVAEFGVPVYEGAAELLGNNLCEVVYVAAPSHLHKDVTVLAAAARKHVIVEKPMAMTIGECDLMIDAARRNNVHLVVGHTHSFDLPIRKAAELVRSGSVGDVAMINTWNFNDYLYRPRWAHELRTELGGGIIHNQVPHQIDIVRMLGGGLVRSIRAMAWGHDLERPTEGRHLTFLQFEGGAAASVTFSGCDYFDTDEFSGWIGELGERKTPGNNGAARRMLESLGGPDAEKRLKASRTYGVGIGLTPAHVKPAGHPHFGVLLISCSRGDIRPLSDRLLIYDDAGIRELPLEPPSIYPDKRAVLDEMYAAIRSEHEPPHNGEWGRATQEVCEAILISAKERREIYLSRQVPFRSN